MPFIVGGGGFLLLKGKIIYLEVLQNTILPSELFNHGSKIFGILDVALHPYTQVKNQIFFMITSA